MNGKPSFLVMLGFDAEKLPRAARYNLSDEPSVVKAADLMGLRVAQAKSDAAVALAHKLPEGKIFASGKGTVPRVKQGLYDQLVAALEFQGPLPAKIATSNGPLNNGLMTAAKSLWDSIKVGSVVLAFDTTDPQLPCWCAAIVQAIAKDNETLTVRWRDYPGFKPFTTKRSAIGLLPPKNL